MRVYAHIQLVTFHGTSGVLDNPQAHILDIHDRAIGQDADIGCYGHARLHLCAAGCDAVPLATDVGVFFGAIGRAAERPGVCKGQIGLGVQLCGQVIYLSLKPADIEISGRSKERYEMKAGHALPVG